MVENELKGEHIVEPEVKEEDKQLTFTNESIDFTDKKLSITGNGKTINEVVDIAKSPDKLQIVRGSKTINIEKITLSDGTITYAKE
jgi:hypothetical protein